MSLKMTEPYATTIAQVVPVILLVAVVEVQQIHRRVEDRSAALTAVFRSAVDRVQADPGSAVLREIYGDLDRVQKDFDDKLHRTRTVLYAIWTVTVAVLAGTEASVLLWLANDARAASPLLAWSSFIALTGGVFVLCNLVGVTRVSQARQERRWAKEFTDVLGRRPEGAPARES
ncbi:hypothetical protein ACFCYM_21405 [Streptomyces sp. NPDC056254]|uniref:hypothetical protein n=1 Tax=Streptomyces sp. NPDC056254 TaxID=3345763 RepID=UPI0035D69392